MIFTFSVMYLIHNCCWSLLWCRHGTSEHLEEIRRGYGIQWKCYIDVLGSRSRRIWHSVKVLHWHAGLKIQKDMAFSESVTLACCVQDPEGYDIQWKCYVDVLGSRSRRIWHSVKVLRWRAGLKIQKDMTFSESVTLACWVQDPEGYDIQWKCYIDVLGSRSRRIWHSVKVLSWRAGLKIQIRYQHLLTLHASLFTKLKWRWISKWSILVLHMK